MAKAKTEEEIIDEKICSLSEEIDKLRKRKKIIYHLKYQKKHPESNRQRALKSGQRLKFCEFCKKEYKAYTWAHHLKTKKHITNAQKVKQ